MNAVAVILAIVLSQHGYWIGGREGQIAVQWAAKAGMPAADLRWELLMSNVSLATGRTRMDADERKIIVRIVPPEVRVRTVMTWKYILTARQGGRELERGEQPIEIFPDSLLHALADRVGKHQVTILENKPDLAAVFEAAKAPYSSAADATKLELSRSDAILIGPDVLDDSLFGQLPVHELASAGASVMIFRQTRIDDLAGYELARRTRPARINWLTDHPLLAGLDEKILGSIGDAGELDVAVRLPADEPALAIAAWPREAPADKPVPTDALLATKAIGKGRIVLCQLAIGDFRADPRAQILLSNAIDYLLSAPEPTVRPSQRAAIPAGKAGDKSIITVGGKP